MRASNTIYVTRNKNILFTVLAQFMGTEALNTRLILIETTAFESPEADMLDIMTRLIADRAIGEIFFKNEHVMDVELSGDAARDIIAENATDERPAIIPSSTPYNTKAWPWPTDPGDGSAGTMQELGD